MSISTWLTGVATERRANALVQARVNGAPVGRADLGEVDPALISALGRALLDPDPRRVRAAVEVLGLTGAPEAVAPLVRALGHGDLWLRAAMSRALQQLGAPPYPVDTITLAAGQKLTFTCSEADQSCTW